jgi:UDP-N-acetylmuramyl pentapeptide phosphotransferase/UDP-N-acetylglucosamine-1-phosphate transferase
MNKTLIIITFIISFFIMISMTEYFKHMQAYECMKQGMQWSHSYGGSCKR